MSDLCPYCRRALYCGTVREVQADECALEGGVSCRAYLAGYGQGVRDLGVRLSARIGFEGEMCDAVLSAVVATEGGPR